MSKAATDARNRLSSLKSQLAKAKRYANKDREAALADQISTAKEDLAKLTKKPAAKIAAKKDDPEKGPPPKDPAK